MTQKNNLVFNKLAEVLVNEKYADVVYLDPPYNQRQYGANYSPLNYIALADKNIVLTGKTGLIENYNKSTFSSKSKVKKVFTQMVKDLKCKYIILSYNNEGLLSKDEIKNILLTKGDIKLYKIKYQKFKAQKSVKTKFVEEYIWFVDTSQITDIFEEIEVCD